MFFVLWINQISAQPEILEKNISEAFGNIVGGIVFIDADNKKISYNETLIEEKFPPCSTFKIWNALIGLEYGIITSLDEKFYTWDGVTRSIPDWNKNLILREAFKVSCVPAFQNLARKIGNKSMQKWIDSINYGDRDISSGIDDFWLPRKDKKSILISAKEQVKLISKLINKQLPFKESSINTLKKLMLVDSMPAGKFYGKTGSGTDYNLNTDIGWFVGFAELENGIIYFACIVTGDNLSGIDAKKIVKAILVKSNLM